MVKAFIGAGFDALKLRTLQICQKPCNDRCSWVCSMMSILYLYGMCGFIYTYGVGSSLLVSTDRVSSKTSKRERATVRVPRFWCNDIKLLHVFQ